ncbi:hypothetical protein KI387_024794, partial [Taxus chinensis]
MLQYGRSLFERFQQAGCPTMLLSVQYRMQSHVGVSFENPDYTTHVVATGTLSLLEAVCFHVQTTGHKIKYYQDRSSEMEAYGLFSCNGILFNHESPRRGENFVTRKITRDVGWIKTGLQNKLYLGNLKASRDRGFSGDYVEAMWLMLQQDEPNDYVVATDDSQTVEEFLEEAFGYVDLNWKDYVNIDP